MSYNNNKIFWTQLQINSELSRDENNSKPACSKIIWNPAQTKQLWTHGKNIYFFKSSDINNSEMNNKTTLNLATKMILKLVTKQIWTQFSA